MSDDLEVLCREILLTVQDVDARIALHKAHVETLQRVRYAIQRTCAHAWGEAFHTPATSHEDPVEGDTMRTCKKCEFGQMLSDGAWPK